MGCCAGANPRNQEIDRAQSRDELIKAMNHLIEINEDERTDLESHIKKGTEIQTQHLKNFSDEDITKRISYLDELNGSYKELISTIEMCSDVSLIKFIIIIRDYH